MRSQRTEKEEDDEAAAAAEKKYMKKNDKIEKNRATLTHTEMEEEMRATEEWKWQEDEWRYKQEGVMETIWEWESGGEKGEREWTNSHKWNIIN